MIKLLKSVTAPIMSLAILIMGNTLFITFTSLRLKLDGHSIEIVGYATSAYFAGLLIGSMRCNRFIERVGHIRAYATFAALFVFFSTLQAIFNPIWVWISVRFLIGLFMAGLFVVIESWLLSKSSRNTKGRVLSMYMITYFASQGIGQLLLNIADPRTIIPFAIIILLAAISIVPICVTRLSAPIIQGGSYLNIFKLFKKSPLGTAGCLFAGLISGPVYGLIPVYIRGHGFSIKEVSFAMGITIFSGLILQWPLGQLSDLIDRRKVIFISTAFTAGAALLIGLNSIYSFLHVFILLSIFGGFCFTIYPLSLTHGSDMVEEKDLIVATAGLALIYSSGAVIGPVVASYCMDMLGPKGLFFYISTIGAALGAISLHQIVKKSPVPREEKIQYKDIPRTQTFSELTPEKTKKGE